jgi:uncharacterized membrane protein
MWNRIGRWIAPALMTAGALGGLAFAWSSSLDYARHLDRRVHDLRCGFVPGVAAAPGTDEGCRAAIYSPYAALMRDRLWGGLPISLFAIGAFSFFAALGLYLLLAGRTASRRVVGFAGLASLAPAAASAFMAYLAWTRLGTFCKTCMGIYFSSAVLAIGGVLGWIAVAGEPSGAKGEEAERDSLQPRPAGNLAMLPGWLLLLATFATMPALAYARSAPSHDAQIGACGKLVRSADDVAIKATLGVAPPTGLRTPVVMIVDPLCPSCRALHRRMDAEGYLEQMDARLVLFPLDSKCNWMLDREMHPGACQVSKAVICAQPKGQAAQVLEWAYQQQEALVAAAKSQGAKAIDGFVDGSFPGLSACMNDTATEKTLDDMMRFAIDNRLPVSTPQLVIGDQRMCEEDTDMGLVYSLRRLAPQMKPRSL